MTGEYTLKVWTSKVRYEICVRRKYTFINGESGSGKTKLITLLDMAEGNRQIRVSCTIDFEVITSVKAFRNALDSRKGKKTLFFIDEVVCNRLYLLDGGIQFAKDTMESEGYFILITRKQFATIPYSVREIYDLKRRMDSFNRYDIVLSNTYEWNNCLPCNPDCFITEDSRVGYLFFKNSLSGCDVISAYGNSNVDTLLKEILNTKNDYNIVCVFADGAAYGCYIKRLIETVEEGTRGSKKRVDLLLFESFEYVILRSGIFKVEEGKLLKTYEYADSTKYPSWERYYTDLLEEVSNGSYSKSSKSLPMFLSDSRNVKRVFDFIKEVSQQC